MEKIEPVIIQLGTANITDSDNDNRDSDYMMSHFNIP